MTAPLYFKSAMSFRRWLEAHAAIASELTVGYYKIGSGHPCVTWSESVDEALCFGWIDGVRKRIDNESYSIRFTPRKHTSNWSAINIAKFARLQAQGRMRPAGVKAFAHRKDEKSMVYAYEQEVTAELSAQERRRFKREKVAWNFFEGTPPSYRKVVLHWVTTAKRVDTRASRFARLVQACAASKRLT